ncbi:hypothetical protein [Dysgonomonas sp. 520]|uniref:hypothetical protein n=1 Tax=Dysgonomonas sp. 520 TaxID=2302931 RepID=UPI0013D8478B|nr:hypothetical protein [Dysgonomonas sp. 520]NDW11063.1 hypothetical protein [Dysgonomonas sp. 520]
MAKIYTIFIGGSGARVLRSLMMLLASGVKPSVCDEIVPIMIDYDKENADLVRALDALETYREIHRSAYKNDLDEDLSGFFSTKVSSVGEVGASKGSFFVTIPGGEKTFANKIGFEDMDNLSKKFLTTIYSDWNDKSREDWQNGQVDMNELNLNIKKGFKGNPNIGSAIFNEVLDTDIMRNYLNSVSANDRVFVVGSIFGGTGATGIPQIVNRCRDLGGAVKKVPVGLNMILPYFDLKEDSSKDSNSTIDPKTFYSKTKASLYYYESAINKKVQEIYYIGLSGTEKIENNDGGEGQKNEAHVVDLLSAMSIIEFGSRPEISMDNDSPDCYIYNSQEDSNYTLNVFAGDEIQMLKRYLYPFKGFGYFWNHYRSNILSNSKGKSADDSSGLFGSAKVYYKYCFKDDLNDSFRAFKSNLENFLFMKNLEEFDFSYESWLRELSAMGFSPFYLDDKHDYTSMVKTGSNSITGNTKDNLIARYDKNAEERMKKDKEKKASKQSVFINIVSDACLELASKK